MKAMKLVSSASLIIGAALSLAACGQSNKDATKSAKKFPEQTPQKTAKKGGTLNYAIETDTPFKGIFDSQLSVDQVDTDVMQFGNEALLLNLIRKLKLSRLPLKRVLSGQMASKLLLKTLNIHMK